MDISVWQECLQCLRDRIPQQQFNQWISPLQAELTRDGVVLFAPNQYILDEVSARYFSVIEEVVSQFRTTALTEISLSVGAKKDSVAVFTSESSSKKELEKTSIVTEADVANHNLNDFFEFNNFVEGQSNQLAKAAALQVASYPGQAYNPLFLYGGVGLGKTHLTHAVGNYVMQSSEKKVIYLNSEKFVADMVRSLQANSIDKFKAFYRKADVLLIDDVQFLAGKDRSQEEFFHTFNYLVEEGKQIILTSDRFPKEIYGIEERLKSRFSSGLTVVVEPPELETRVAILINKARDINVHLSQEVAFFIAKKIKSNVRELEGALKRVVANAEFTGNKIDMPFVQEVLRDLLDFQDQLISVDNIIKTVSEYFKIKVVDLLSTQRKRCFARPRQIAMLLCKELTNHSLSEIGEAFSKRDHTTVLHACKQVQRLKDQNTDVYEDYIALYRILSG